MLPRTCAYHPAHPPRRTRFAYQGPESAPVGTSHRDPCCARRHRLFRRTPAPDRWGAQGPCASPGASGHGSICRPRDRAGTHQRCLSHQDDRHSPLPQRKCLIVLSWANPPVLRGAMLGHLGIVDHRANADPGAAAAARVAMLALAAKRLRDLFRAFAARGRFTSPLVLTVLAEPLWRLAARRRRAAPGGLSWRKSAPNVAASEPKLSQPSEEH